MDLGKRKSKNYGVRILLLHTHETSQVFVFNLRAEPVFLFPFQKNLNKNHSPFVASDLFQINNLWQLRGTSFLLFQNTLSLSFFFFLFFSFYFLRPINHIEKGWVFISLYAFLISFILVLR